MGRFNFQTLRKKPTEWLTQRVLYGLIGIAVIVFALFYLVGFHQPFEENADFNAPLFTNLLLLLMGLLVVLSVVLSIVTIGRSLRLRRGKANGLENNVPVRRLEQCVVYGTFVIVALSFVAGSSQAMRINGVAFHDWWWLKVADMFVYSAAILLLVAVGCVIYGATKYYRKAKRN